MSCFAIAARSPALTQALLLQSYRSWELVDSTDRVLRDGHLGLFVERPGRYMLVSLDDDALAQVLRADRNLLARLLVLSETAGRSLMVIRSGDRALGFALYTAAFADHPWIPQRESLFYDVYCHAVSLWPRMVGEVRSAVEVFSGAGEPLPTGGALAPTGYRRPWDGHELIRACSTIRGSVPDVVRTCVTNEFYGHLEIFSQYCGIPSRFPIKGRIQHGWSPGIKSAVFDDTDLWPVYVWSRRVADLIHDQFPVGSGDVVPIGAPYLYLPPLPDAGPPVGERWLLAMPNHSIRSKIVRESWEPYADHLAVYAREHKFDITTACLGPVEYASAEVCNVFLQRGFRVLSNGSPESPDFLHKLRGQIRQHHRVVSNRIGTALWLAAIEGREVDIAGPPMNTTPPDYYDDQTRSVEWTRKEYPEMFGGLDSAYDKARDELGIGFRRSPLELRDLFWGWVL